MSQLKSITVTGKLKEGFIVKTEMRSHKAVVDRLPEGGRKDTAPTPLEYLFVSLAGCIGTIAGIKAQQEKINLRSLDISVSGDIGTDVLMGKSDDARPGFQNIIIHVNMDCDLSPEEKQEFLHDVDRRCPISDNISNENPLSFDVK